MAFEIIPMTNWAGFHFPYNPTTTGGELITHLATWAKPALHESEVHRLVKATIRKSPRQSPTWEVKV